MSRTAYDSLVHKTKGIRWILGTFQANGTSDPDVLVGDGWTVEYTDTGKFTVTLDETFWRPVSLVVQAHETVTGAGESQDIVAATNELDLTANITSFVVYTRVNGTDTNTDNQQVSFMLAVADTSVTNQRSS